MHSPVPYIAGRRRVFLVLAAVASTTLCGCTSKPTSPVIASVGKAVLTVDDLLGSIPPEYRGTITREQNVNYVRQWVDNELLYQEAIRMGMPRERQIRERLDRMKRDLLCAELLARLSATTGRTAVTDSMVRKYYEENRSSFVRTRNTMRFVQIVVDDMASAANIRARATPAAFAELAAQYSRTPVEDPARAPFVAVDELPPEVGQALWALRVGGISPPIKSALGYHVALMLEKREKGSICDMSEVHDEIVDRLSTQVKKQEIDRALSELRLKTTVSFSYDRIP